MDIGDIIRKLRKEKGLTQKKLAELTGIAEITIRQYEAKKYIPKTEQLKKICRILDVNPNSMLFANSIDFSKVLVEDEMENWNNETLDFFASWLVANGIFFERIKNDYQNGYLFHFDNQSYFLTLEHKQQLSNFSIEMVKILIKSSSEEQ